MSYLYESNYRAGWDNYIRVFDTETNRSICFKIQNKWEYYKPFSQGTYTCITDQTIKLAKFLGTKKEADGNFGVRSPVDVYIRDHFWDTKQFNLNPRVFYLDIETRSGQSFVENTFDNKVLKIRHNEYIQDLSVKQIKVSYEKFENYEYFDEVLNEWKPINDSIYFKRNGFPEPETALEEVTLIEIFDSKSNSMIVLGLRDFIDHYNKLSELEYPVKYIKFDNEIALFNGFFAIFKKLNPLIVYAWNGNNFDFPYLYNRAKKLGLDSNNLSNYGDVSLDIRTDDNNEKKITLRSSGHFFIDMIDAYKSVVMKNQPSYSLEYISQIELKQGKIEHDEFTSFDSFYTGKDYIISDKPYADQIREEIRQLKISEKNNTITDDQKKKLNELLQFQFVYYGVKDVYLLKLIDKVRNLTNIACAKACRMGVGIGESIYTLKPWGAYILNEFYKLHLVDQPHTLSETIANVIGGFVRQPVTGKHEWVVSEDVNSMYPLLSMVSFNMSPETYVPLSKAPAELREFILTYYTDQDEDRCLNLSNEVKLKTIELLKKYNFSMGINGALFSNEKIGLIPKLVLDIYHGRKKDKNKMLSYEKMYEVFKKYLDTASVTGKHTLKDPLEYTESEYASLSKDDLTSLMEKCEDLALFYETEQLVQKILMNSLYGAFGKPKFVLFNEKIAQAITGNGRYFIKMSANNMEKYLQNMEHSETPYIVYGDTDSLYVCINPIMQKYIALHKNESLDDYCNYADKFENEHMQPVIQKSIKAMATLFNACDSSVIGMKRENIMTAAIFVAKKKYFADVIDKEGTRYPEDDLYPKVMGLELARATTPNWCKEYLSKALKYILTNEPSTVADWINGVREQFIHANINDLAMNGSVKSVNYSLTDKDIPWMSKAAIYHNMYVKANKLENQVSLLKGGDKCKILFLRQPNNFHTDKVAFVSNAILPYIENTIDYDVCFEKTFINPIQNIMKVLNINLKKTTVDLTDW